MAHQFDLIPEGRAERVLLQVIGFEKPNHADGIGDTLNKIENRGNHFALGIVDNDKRKPALFDRYQILLKEQHALQLLQKPQSLHFLIVLHPAIEKWLIDCADECRVNIPGFDFSNPKQLSRITKDFNVGENRDFRKFLKALSQTEGSRLQTLRLWIEELRNQHVW